MSIPLAENEPENEPEDEKARIETSKPLEETPPPIPDFPAEPPPPIPESARLEQKMLASINLNLSESLKQTQHEAKKAREAAPVETIAEEEKITSNTRVSSPSWLSDEEEPSPEGTSQPKSANTTPKIENKGFFNYISSGIAKIISSISSAFGFSSETKEAKPEKEIGNNQKTHKETSALQSRDNGKKETSIYGYFTNMIIGKKNDNHKGGPGQWL